ncbi:cytochrome c1 signal peptide protein, partial [mine drainage metagenome]
GHSVNGNAPASAADLTVVSLFAGGKITDNFGAFMQWTGQKYNNLQSGSQSSYQAAAIDNTEFRYADRTVTPNNDLILGAYINNRAMMSDVWNNFGAWESGWINYFNAGNALAPT